MGGDGQLEDGVWLAMEASARVRTFAAHLAEKVRARVHIGPDCPAGFRVGIAIVDDKHRPCLARARAAGGFAVQTILVTGDARAADSADFVLSDDADSMTLLSMVEAADAIRREALDLSEDVRRRASAVGTIRAGSFTLRTLDEARNLATMLALACPDSELVAVGLQELLVNAVEHGNLEIGAALKQALLVSGGWREEIERRQRHPDYRDRKVAVDFRRGDRMISIRITDDGSGFDFGKYVAGPGGAEAYRGRGIAIARELSFSSIAYSGRGNTVEAIIVPDRGGSR